MNDSNGQAPVPMGLHLVQAAPDPGASRALRSMIDELRAEAPPELAWDEIERKLMIDVVKSDAARAAQQAAAPRSPFLQMFAFAAAAALIALGVSTADSGATTATARIAPVAVDVATIAAAPGEPGARDLAKLDAGNVIVTSGAPVTFRREGVVAFTVAPSSRITVRSVGDSRGIGTTIALEQGSIRAEVVPRPASEGLVEAFAVQIESTRVAVHGTAFSVSRTDTGIVVDVEHGTVAVGPTGNVGVTTGHILVGPSRASFSLDGGRTSRLLARDPAPAAPVIAAAPTIAAAPLAGSLAALDPLEPAPSVLGVHPAIPVHLTVAAVDATPAPTPIDTVHAAPAIPAPAAALNEVVISARLHECFERASLAVADQTNAVSVVSTLHLTLQADGSVRSAIFDPPLKPELMACAGGAIAGKFADGNRRIDLPVSFHAR